jgi:hypothetical protein
MSCWQSSPRASIRSRAAEPGRSAKGLQEKTGDFAAGAMAGLLQSLPGRLRSPGPGACNASRGRLSDPKPGTEGRPGRATRLILQKPARSRRSHAAIPSDGVVVTAFAASASCQERAAADAKRAGVPCAPAPSGYGADPFHQYPASFRGRQPHPDRVRKRARFKHSGDRAVGACALGSLHDSPDRTIEKHASNGAPVALTRPLARSQIKGTRRCARAPARRSPGPWSRGGRT